MWMFECTVVKLHVLIHVEVLTRFEFEKKSKGERERKFATKAGFPIS
jgi:hypothetical protein